MSLSTECWSKFRVDVPDKKVTFSSGDEKLTIGYDTWNRIGRPEELLIINERRVIDIEGV